MKSARLLVQATKAFKDKLIKKSVSTPASAGFNPNSLERFKFKLTTNRLEDGVYRINTIFKRVTGLKEREDLEKSHRTLQKQLYESTQRKIAYGIVLLDIKNKRALVEEELSRTSRHDSPKYSDLLKKEVELSAQEKNATAQYDSQYAEESNLSSTLSASAASIYSTELRRSDYVKFVVFFINTIIVISSILSYVFQWGDFRTSLKKLQKDLEVIRERNDAGSYWEFLKQSGKTFGSGSCAALIWCGSTSMDVGKYLWGGCVSGTSWCVSAVKTGGQGAYCGLKYMWKQTKGFMWKEEVKQENFILRWSKGTVRGIKWLIWGD